VNRTRPAPSRRLPPRPPTGAGLRLVALLNALRAILATHTLARLLLDALLRTAAAQLREQDGPRGPAARHRQGTEPEGSGPGIGPLACEACHPAARRRPSSRRARPRAPMCRSVAPARPRLLIHLRPPHPARPPPTPTPGIAPALRVDARLIRSYIGTD
jgi:hypothetical protein